MLEIAALRAPLRTLFALAGAWFLMAASAPEARAYDGTLDLASATISGDTSLLIASDKSRNAVVATGTYRYHDLSALVGSESFRLVYELLDAKGLVLALSDGAGGSTTSVVHALGAHSFTEGLGQDSVLLTDDASLQPFVQLSPTTAHRVRVTAERFEFLTWNEVDTVTTSPRQILHFASSDPDDLSYNILGWVDPVAFTQTYAIDTAVYSVGHQHMFKASIPFHLARYDHYNSLAASSLNVTLRFTLSLFDAAGNEIPLDDEDAITVTRSVPEFVQGTPRMPYYLDDSLDVEFNPAQQLRSISKTYRLVATMQYQKASLPAQEIAEAANSTPTTQLLHFNGALQFGTGVPCRTELAFLADGFSVAASQPDPLALDLILHGISGVLSSDHSFYYSATVGDWKARLDDTGTLLFTDDRLPIKMGTLAQTPVDRQIGALTVTLADPDDLLGMPVKLTNQGATSFLTVRLPAGMGWREDTTEPLLHAQVPFGVAMLGSTLVPALSVLDWSPNEGECWVVEETKPVWIRTSRLRWWTGTGRFELSPTGCRYVRATELEDLEDTSDWLLAPAPAVLRKPSNEQVYRYAQSVLATDSTGNPVTTAISTDGDGAARLTAEFALAGSGSFYTHFPSQTKIGWPTGMPSGNGGFLRITNGEVVPGESRITDPQTAVLHYSAACSEGCEALAEDPDSQRYMALTPGGPAFFTSDGGLWFTGQIATRAAGAWFNDFWVERDTVTTLTWGRRPDAAGYLEFAHQTQAFSSGTFHMPGSSLDDPDADVAFGQQPMALLHTAVTNPQAEAGIYRPDSLGDRRGLGDYAGINLRVAAQPIIAGLAARQGGISCLGDASSAGTGPEPIWYPVQDYSHYYVRSSGISGIHAAADFPDTLVVYGYAFTFDRFGLSFLDSANQASVTKGSVVLPYPTGFTQEFDRLKLSCLGSLRDAEVPESAGDKTLAYWQTAITPLTFEFRVSADPCSLGTGSLCLGVKTGAALLSEPLLGTLAIQPDGTLITPVVASSDPAIPDDLTSRLTAPNTLRVRGPRALDGTFEQYYVMPASHAYFNDWHLAQTDLSPEANGFLSLAGLMDVPFFEDVRVQIQTRGTNSATAPTYVTGGWQADGKTLFDDLGFDPTNAGYPVSAAGSLADYRAGGINGGTTYLPHARYDWLGLLPFDFPMTWHPALRTFQSPAAVGMNVLVLNTEAEIKYLSAEQAEITFGVELAGLPQINVAECAFSQLDEATGEVTGAVKSLVKAASQEVADAIDNGIDGAQKLTTDRLGELLEQALDQQTEALVGQLYTRVAAEWDTATGSWSSSIALRTALESQREALKTAVRNAIVSGAGIRGELRTEPPADLIAELNTQLLAIQNGIRSVIGVDVDVNGTAIPNPIQEPVEPGIAPLSSRGLMSTTVYPDGHADYQVLPGLIYALIEDLSPSLADALSALLAGPLTALNARANAVLAKGQPALQRVRAELLRLESEVAALRRSLDPALPSHEFRDHLQSILDEADVRGDLDAYAQTVVDRLEARLSTLVNSAETMRIDFPQLDEDEIKARFRGVIRDSFAELDLTQELTVGIRQRFFDLDGMIRGAYDALFDQLNEAIKGVAAEALPDLSTKLDDFLGPFGGVVQGGGLEGYARINGDALRLLRLDLDLELNVPDPLAMHAYLEIRQQDSIGDGSGCTTADGEPRTEVILGATDVPVHWLDADIELSLMTKFVFADNAIAGFGGALEMTRGEVSFEGFTIRDFGAALAFGAGEAYLAARAGMDFQDYHVAGALFFGKTCTLTPLFLVDPEVAAVLGDPPFTGAYVYGECGMPIYGNSCVFRVEALVGAGVFFFVEGPTFGGKLVADISGEALCAVHVSGGMTLIGLKDADGFVYRGEGRVSGSIGSCPFCLKFRKKLSAVNRYNTWSVSY